MNNTLQNGFMVLEYLAEDGGECSVKELADHFQLPNSHICRLLKTLVETGYVEQTPGSRKYRISLKILNLSHTRLSRITLRTIARPHLQQLVRELDQPVYLSASHHGFSLIIATEYPQNFAGDAGLAVGQIHLVNRSACGKICAAWAEPEEREELFRHCDWSAQTPSSITSPAGFRKELEMVRRNGCARMAGENIPGLGAVAAPVFEAAGQLAGALGVILPDDEALWTPELWNRFTGKVKMTAKSISFAAGQPME